jgi:hypothetical protein
MSLFSGLFTDARLWFVLRETPSSGRVQSDRASPPLSPGRMCVWYGQYPLVQIVNGTGISGLFFRRDRVIATFEKTAVEGCHGGASGVTICTPKQQDGAALAAFGSAVRSEV